MKKILITGGAGYIGGVLVDQLKSHYQITVLDNLLYEDRYLKHVKFIKGSVTDYELLESIIHQFDAIIWLAAIVGDAACNVNPELTKEINEDSVVWLVNHYRGKIIYMSTCSVYGKTDSEEELTETAPTNPLSLYAKSKLAAEQYIFYNHNDFLIYRLGTVYGLGDQVSRLRLDLIVNNLTYKAWRDGKIQVGKQTQWRPHVHVQDVAKDIHKGLMLNFNGLYNVSTLNRTISDVAEQVVKVIPKTTIEYIDGKTEDSRSYSVSNKKWLEVSPSVRIPDLQLGIYQIWSTLQGGRIKNPDDPIYINADYLNKIKIW